MKPKQRIPDNKVSEIVDELFECKNRNKESGYCKMINHHIENGIAIFRHCRNCPYFEVETRTNKESWMPRNLGLNEVENK